MKPPARTKSRVLKTVGSPSPSANVRMRVRLATMRLVDRDVKRIRSGFDPLECRSDILRPLDHEWRYVEAEHASRRLRLAHFQHGLGIAYIEDDGQPAQLRDNLTQEF